MPGKMLSGCSWEGLAGARVGLKMATDLFPIQTWAGLEWGHRVLWTRDPPPILRHI